MKDIIVTGGNGFIGSHLINALAKKFSTYKINIIDKFPKETIEINQLIEPTNLVIHNVDITNYTILSDTIKDLNPEFVFHLAAITNASRDPHDLQLLVDVNIKGTINLYQSLKGKVVKRLIHLSTSEVYGDNPPPFNEEMLMFPKSPYSASKVSSEMFAKMYSEILQIPTVIVRPFNVFGEGQKALMLIPQAIISSILGNPLEITLGEQTRESNHVSDIVEGLILCAQVDKAAGQIINLGCGVEMTVKEIVKRIVEKTGRKDIAKFGSIPYRKNEIFRMYCDNSKAKRLLGWEPKIEFDEGLDRAISWYSNFLK